ncbi:serine hydrolase-domain-containing protein [Aspergillus novoparasiticus]|uniref:Serine hydrolase-domain-containing protein n=1 Tax=Aspergillus novoparasiticus TaxID=986946 RepID=A0A5N6EII1_9EURO|nr:serine hydrolase-domain-containing protein [Aspergillus novoparasiticus]
MPLPHFKVIIVGASIEGITLTYCLHPAGINYHQLGLLDRMTDFVVPIETAYMTLTDTGSHEIGFPKVLRERFGYSPAFMSKRKILEMLYNCLPRNDKIKFGKNVVRIEAGASCLRVVTWDGYDYEGDLVVGADGAHSKVRGEMARLSKLEELTMDVNNDMTVEYIRITGVSTRCLDYPALTCGTMLTSNSAGQNITCLVGKDAEILWNVFLKLDCRSPYGSAPELSEEEMRQRCESAELFNQTLCTGLNWRDVCDRRKSTAPHIGQDTSCSIEDATELANMLYGCLRRRHTKPSTEEMDTVLGTFTQRRIRRMKPIYREAKRAIRHMTFCGSWDRLIARYYLTRNEQVIAEWFSKDAAGEVTVKLLPLPERSELAWSDHQLEQHTYRNPAIIIMTKSLPRIACFHGGGSKGAIYEVQCSQLAGLLKNDFQFVFFDGPFESGPGPGVLPAFRDYKPFRSWFKKDGSEIEQSDGSGYDISGRDGVERVWKLMEAAGPGGEWVGVMGFSQGTRITGGLLLDQQRRTAFGELGNTPKLKFGVLCMGGGAPMVSEIGHQMADMGSTDLVKIPTLHVHGLKDMFLALGRQQHATYYESSTSKVYEVDYHHAMPWYKHEVQRLAELIRELYRESSGN